MQKDAVTPKTISADEIKSILDKRNPLTTVRFLNHSGKTTSDNYNISGEHEELAQITENSRTFIKQFLAKTSFSLNPRKSGFIFNYFIVTTITIIAMIAVYYYFFIS